jgi:two-component system sensor histidine kinase MprB
VSLRARLTLAAAAAVAVAVLIASAVAYFAVRSQLVGQIDSSLRDGAAVIAERPRFDIAPAGDGFVVVPVRPLESLRVYLQVIGAQAGSDVVPRRGVPMIPISEHAREVAAGTADAFFADATVDGTHVRVYTVQIGDGRAIQVARSREEVDGTLAKLLWILGGISLGGVALAAGLGLVVARSALRPVRRLTETVEDVTATHDLTRRIDVRSQDELGRLAGGFNTMLGELDASLKAQRQLVADASHELRTPLTSMRTNAEVLARTPDLPAGERAKLLDDLTSQAAELSQLVENLVDLARGSEEPQELVELRLDLLVEDALERARRDASGITFTLAAEPTVVAGDRAGIVRAVRNLLDNAAKWSPPGGTVEVVVRGGEVLVRDQGPGIANEDLPHVFDRFYRAASARGRPGSGLGLAIVRQVAESHGGSVTATRANGGGAELRLRLAASS